MTIYEVNFTVNADIADMYAIWLGEHIREILSIDGFLSAEWFEVESDGDARQWCVQYRLSDRESLDRYFSDYAEQMRADGVRRFGGSFSATRRVMERRGEYE